MHKAWSGEWPIWRAPSIRNIRMNDRRWNVDHIVEPDSEVQVDVDLNAFEGEVQWQCALFPESQTKKMGGDRQESLEEIPTDFSFVNPGAVVFKTPKNPGAYRVFVKACRDGNNCSSANVPFLVRK